MRRGFFLRLFLILIAIMIVVGVMFVVDFNLIASKSSPKFCIKEVTHSEDAVEYVGFGYKIIRYQINEEEQKLKVGSIFLKYDSNFIANFKPKMNIRGYIRKINNSGGAFVIYVESNGVATKKYDYDKVYATVSKETEIKNLDNGKEYTKSDLKVGQVIELSFIGDVQEIYPARGTAGIINIINDIESEEESDE